MAKSLAVRLALNQSRSNRRATSSAPAEAGNCEAGYKASPIGEPLNECGHGHDIAQSEPDTA